MSDLAVKASREIAHALCNLSPAAPFVNVGDEQQAALTRLANICHPLASPDKQEHLPVAADVRVHLIVNTTPMPRAETPTRMSKPSPRVPMVPVTPNYHAFKKNIPAASVQNFSQRTQYSAVIRTRGGMCYVPATILWAIATGPIGGTSQCNA
jgi:hypothetical protein